MNHADFCLSCLTIEVLALIARSGLTVAEELAEAALRALP